MSKIPVRKFAYQLMIFSVIIAAIGVAFQWLIPKYISPAIPFIVIFFFFITLFSLYIVLRTPNQVSGKKFVATYMVSRIVKMFSIFIFLILYMILNKEDRWNFAAAFLIIYFSYSVFEIIALKKDQ
jgi:L-asparagine transporter-like permease